jgi:uncharacterized repeat protein (TIGR04138 family)
MPKSREKLLEVVVREVGMYPMDAYLFVEQGLRFAVQRVHGPERRGGGSRHITGQQLCEGLREFALQRWGMLAGMVLRRWNIASTLDFGRIVYAMIDAGLMQKTEEDSLDDFRNVFDFRTGFDSDYKISVTERPNPQGNTR